MPARIKYSKVAVVVFLTVLIWVWADMAKTEDITIPNAVIKVAKSTSEDLWVSFDDQPSVRITKIVLRGATTIIDELQRELTTGRNKLQFELDVAQEQVDAPGNNSLLLLPFLRKQRVIRDRGLKVESCQPKMLSVKVVKLRKESLEVRCFDENGSPVPATSDPLNVDIYVPDTNVAYGFAQVQLNNTEIDDAREGPISMKPFITLAPEQIKWAEETVNITIREEQVFEKHLIKSPVLGYLLSDWLLRDILSGKYEIEILNKSIVRGPFEILATREAMNAYKNMTFQIILQIKDDHVKSEETHLQELFYNFPPKFIRTDQIRLEQPQPAVAKFKLILRSTTPESSGSSQ